MTYWASWTLYGESYQASADSKDALQLLIFGKAYAPSYNAVHYWTTAKQRHQIGPKPLPYRSAAYGAFAYCERACNGAQAMGYSITSINGLCRILLLSITVIWCNRYNAKQDDMSAIPLSF